MSLSIADWEYEWVKEIHPEWIEELSALQKKNKELEAGNEQLTEKNAQLVHCIASRLIEIGFADHVTDEAIIKAIVSATRVSEDEARRLVAEYCGHQN